ncbi:Uncharacterized [Moorella glycerini]|uniref:DUF5343 domain-containing protein n=1 Tax=Neomoorella stamsii TaxID=1266720 RepID=A0A9X7P6S0_9FIRM|nr:MULTISPECIES: DUF5343 domain-containing protein [Moorella]PRR74603.1 hypothetical protein MOST_10380 [Moorella stamsii]CEP69110.1 Uncharacterized [Moorella glycerini]
MVEGNEKRVTYPSIPVRNWWDLRRKFIQAPPRQVTPGYLASVLGISEAAGKNLIPPLRAVGFIDDEGKPTPLANDWRSEEHYPDVCKTIRENIYPPELLDAFPGPNPDRDAVVSWFSRSTGTGEVAAKKMAAFYLLLCEADPSAQDAVVAKAQSGRKVKLRKKTTTSELIADNKPNDYAPPEDLKVYSGSGVKLPSVHIDIQIHIAADARPEQIDQIFASMAKHLYGRHSE